MGRPNSAELEAVIRFPLPGGHGEDGPARRTCTFAAKLPTADGVLILGEGVNKEFKLSLPLRKDLHERGVPKSEPRLVGPGVSGSGGSRLAKVEGRQGEVAKIGGALLRRGRAIGDECAMIGGASECAMNGADGAFFVGVGVDEICSTSLTSSSCAGSLLVTMSWMFTCLFTSIRPSFFPVPRFFFLASFPPSFTSFSLFSFAQAGGLGGGTPLAHCGILYGPLRTGAEFELLALGPGLHVADRKKLTTLEEEEDEAWTIVAAGRSGWPPLKLPSARMRRPPQPELTCRPWLDCECAESIPGSKVGAEEFDAGTAGFTFVAGVDVPFEALLALPDCCSSLRFFMFRRFSTASAVVSRLECV